MRGRRFQRRFLECDDTVAQATFIAFPCGNTVAQATFAAEVSWTFTT
ncbi:MAG: hypothetical protein Q4A17_05025 [Thermoguttaceae bacterium]|nr:hypothetical protein [Thermoguttaceae bacterium]